MAKILPKNARKGYFLVLYHSLSNQSGLEISLFNAQENGVGGITKTVGTCSIDVLDSKYGFGISAPPGEN